MQGEAVLTKVGRIEPVLSALPLLGRTGGIIVNLCREGMHNTLYYEIVS